MIGYIVVMVNESKDVIYPNPLSSEGEINVHNSLKEAEKVKIDSEKVFQKEEYTDRVGKFDIEIFKIEKYDV